MKAQFPATPAPSTATLQRFCTRQERAVSPGSCVACYWHTEHRQLRLAYGSSVECAAHHIKPVLIETITPPTTHIPSPALPPLANDALDLILLAAEKMRRDGCGVREIAGFSKGLVMLLEALAEEEE